MVGGEGRGSLQPGQVSRALRQEMDAALTQSREIWLDPSRAKSEERERAYRAMPRMSVPLNAPVSV